MNNKQVLCFVVFCLVLLFGCGSGGIAEPSVETVTGTLQYEDSGGVLRPIAFAKVEIHRFRPRTGGIWSWGLDSTTTTDSNGSISVSMPFVKDGVTYGVKVFATNYAAIVWPNDAAHTVPFHREPGEPGTITNRISGTDALDFSYVFRDNWTTQHYNLAETIRHGFDYANSRRDPNETDVIPAANVQPTSVTDSWYNPTADTVVIHSDDVFEDFTILHEYSHFLEEQISSFGWMATWHDGCTARELNESGRIINSAEHAWMEGFADYFAQAVGRSLPPGTLNSTTKDGTPSITTLENQPSPCPALPASFTSETVENLVAATLWDLFDPVGITGSGEAHDSIAGQDVEIFQIFDKEMDTYGTWPTICQFHNAWVGRGLNQAALDSILARHGITSCEGPSPPPPTDTPASPLEACLRVCEEERDACMVDVGNPGGSSAAACIDEFRACQAECS